MGFIEFVWPGSTGEWLAWAVALVTMLVGLALMLVPKPMMALFGLAAPRAAGTSEIRSAFGGSWVGLGLACILLAQPLLYLALGMAFAFAVIGRLISFVLDRSFNGQTVLALLVEIAGAVLPISYALGLIR